MNTVLTTIPDPLLSDLGDFLAGKIGIHFAKERWHDLKGGSTLPHVSWVSKTCNRAPNGSSQHRHKSGIGSIGESFHRG
jgi:hypothetical protein